MVHQLGAAQRWRTSLQSQGAQEGPEPELEPLPTADELRLRWEAEWAAVDEWLPNLTDGFVAYAHEGVPIWQMLAHVVNHGTYHRGQITTMLRQLGVAPAKPMDLIAYYRETAVRT